MNPKSTWPEIQKPTIGILPVGSLEQHGHHLPLETDRIIADAVCMELGKKIKGSFLAPALPYSASFEHSAYPGSISLRSSTILQVIEDIINSFERMGIQQTLIFSGHGGNMLLGNLAQELNVDKPRVLVTPSRDHWDKAYKRAGITVGISEDMHAGEGETSILLYLNERVVKKGYVDVESSKRELFSVLGIKPYTPTGAIGKPTKASIEKGKKLLEALVEEIYQTTKAFIKIGNA